jgi:SlyX protein
MDHGEDGTDANRRTVELEVKLSYVEDLLDELNLVVYRQQQQIDALVRQVAALQQRPADSGTEPRSLRDDLPPHY